jgi:zinc protease
VSGPVGVTTLSVAGALDAGVSDVLGGAEVNFFLKKLNIFGFVVSLHSMKRHTPIASSVCFAGRYLLPILLALGFTIPAVAQIDALPEALSASASAPEATHAQQFTLTNGMTLIVKPDRRAPTAVHMLWVRVGAMDEVDGTSGVAHVLEHMMFKGTPSVPAGEFSRRVAAMGGRENAFTSRDYTGFYQMIPAQRLEDVMRLESDRFVHNQWSDDEFKKELEVVKEERRLRTEDKPLALMNEALNATVFEASPYRRPIVGWMSDLEALTPGDARAFYQRWYVPANAAVVVAGDVDVAKVRALAEKYYGSLPTRAVPERKPRAEPVQVGIKRIAFKAPAEQANVTLAFKVPSLQWKEGSQNDTDALALTVLAAVLDGYQGARLERALTQGPDHVADSAGADNGLWGRGPQLFMLMGVPTLGKTADQVEQALRAQVQRVASEGVTEAELARVKIQWVASEVYKLDSLFNQARELGTQWAQGLPVDAGEQLVQRLRAVTADQVKAVAARYFGDDQLTVAQLVPQPLDKNRRPRAIPAGLRD